jgi:N-sulfoglucosamine sulfohydrolase
MKRIRSIRIRKLSYLSLVVAGVVVTAGCSNQQQAKDPEKPNFIIWVADDQYLESVGCYGGDPLQTPNIDKLAEEGLRFTRAYSTTSICTPARSALYTGMYPIKNGAHPNHSGLKEDIPSMPGIMRELGYRSALVGKTGVHNRPTRPTNTFVWDKEFPLTSETIKGAEWSEKAADKHREMDYAGIEEFIRVDGKPFCLFVASSLPHGPGLTKIENGMEGYPANNWTADYQLGLYMKMLEEAGKRNNTVVIFVSDNGSNTSRSKYTLYEPGVHIPMIIRWPEHVTPGSVSDALVDFTDVMPTLMELVGSEPSAEMDGRSLVPLMNGENVTLRDDLYLSFTCLGVNDVYDPYPIRAVVTERYKLIRNLNHEIDPPKGSGVQKVPEYELFDLSEDPSESVNLYEEEAYAAIRADMEKRLQFWTLEVGDKGMATEYEAVEMFPDKIGHLKMLAE